MKMKLLILCILTMLTLAIVIGCDSERYATQPLPTIPPLSITAHGNPDTIPLGYAAGLYMEPKGGTPPYITEWWYAREIVSEQLATTFEPWRVGTYTFRAKVTDAKDVVESTMVFVECIPLDSIFVPPDTITLPPDTIRIELGPDTVTVVVHDTTTVIITRIDTVLVPVYLPGDTVWQWHYDTVLVYDTTVVHDSTVVYDTTIVVDSVFVPYIVHDTVLVYQTDTLYVQPDTVRVVDTLVDTVYVSDRVIVDTACWQIDAGHLTASVQLENPAGWYSVIRFDWLRTMPPPSGKGYYVDVGGQVFGLAVTGEKHQVSLVGGKDGVYLEENATVTIRLADLKYLSGSAAASPECIYLEGCVWILEPKSP
jgi:hypothetical protein